MPRLGAVPLTSARLADFHPTPSPTLDTSRSPCPWRQHEPETSSGSRRPRSIRRSPPAPTSLRGAHAPPGLDSARRFGLGRERPSPRLGSHRTPQNALPVALTDASATAPTRCASSARKERRTELRRTRTEPERPRTRDAIRAARTLYPTVRVSMLPPMSTRLYRWMETTIRGRLQHRFPRHARSVLRRRSIRCSSVLRTPLLWSVRRRNTSEEARPNRWNRLRHEVRSLLTRPSCREVSPPPSRLHRESPANPLRT